MNEFPWYDEVSAEEPITQGDFIESCPVLVYARIPDLAGHTEQKALLDALRNSAGVEPTRAIVMTQACDLAHGHVRNVILCPIYDLSDYKKSWEEPEKEKGNKTNLEAWQKYLKKIKSGSIWNLAMLDKRELPEGKGRSMSIQVVDFHEVLSIPLEFLNVWTRTQIANRIRLLPPYREHLSQAFARFFMRVGLPKDIELG